mmetsp:Transcript_35778/g.102204  ORF Transcript_35778/g.102204 Transcript_35778/m.102204 type:complete len:206 (-) Transcript_35778:688-1305(-)
MAAQVRVGRGMPPSLRRSRKGLPGQGGSRACCSGRRRAPLGEGSAGPGAPAAARRRERATAPPEKACTGESPPLITWLPPPHPRFPRSAAPLHDSCSMQPLRPDPPWLSSPCRRCPRRSGSAAPPPARRTPPPARRRRRGGASRGPQPRGPRPRACRPCPGGRRRAPAPRPARSATSGSGGAPATAPAPCGGGRPCAPRAPCPWP